MDDALTDQILNAAFTVHSRLGPGLLESAYATCLAYELRQRGFTVITQRAVPIVYGEVEIDAGFRLDLLVNGAVIVEVKSVRELAPVHLAQILTYLKLSGTGSGLLLNFNVVHLRDGIRRVKWKAPGLGSPRGG